MMRIKEHVPNFIDRDEPLAVHDFQSLDELLSLPFVKRHLQGRSPPDLRINHMRPWTEGQVGAHLLTVEDDGYKWWVIGRILATQRSEIESLGLPEAKWKYRDQDDTTPKSKLVDQLLQGWVGAQSIVHRT